MAAVFALSRHLSRKFSKTFNRLQNQSFARKGANGFYEYLIMILCNNYAF